MARDTGPCPGPWHGPQRPSVASVSRAVRSYCRQCLAVCGLIVTVEGDEILIALADNGSVFQ